MKKEDASYVNKKLKEIKYSCDTYERGLSIFQSDIIEKFKNQYPTYIKYLNSKKEEFLSFLKYPETIRKLINSTNAVESVHSSFVLGLTPCGVVALLGRKTKIKKRRLFSIYGYIKCSFVYCN